MVQHPVQTVCSLAEGAELRFCFLFGGGGDMFQCGMVLHMCDGADPGGDGQGKAGDSGIRVIGGKVMDLRGKFGAERHRGFAMLFLPDVIIPDMAAVAVRFFFQAVERANREFCKFAHIFKGDGECGRKDAGREFPVFSAQQVDVFGETSVF